ncbi:hypothetical protein ACSBR2_011081 [Camellia fascicularis]|uniref:Uncharacterized protein n=1 Tax=Camellia lanceoleosa TaxID=1840588 RepID=A0ACC0HH39_9ERIC|nr:hypothetical protein LOK49_LG06G00310 [Camellia lanceoleosa]
MEITEKLLKFKFYILLALAFSLIILINIYVAPSFIGVLAYFWPLLASTAMFLFAVVLFGRTSPPAAEAPGEKAAEGLLDFVAGKPEEVRFAGESSKSEQNLM